MTIGHTPFDYAVCVIFAIFFLFMPSCHAEKMACPATIPGFTIIKNSLFPFHNGDHEECFFAYESENADQSLDPNGCGNSGKGVWFARLTSFGKVIEFDKPSDTFVRHQASLMNGIEAVQFKDVNEDGRRDISVVGINDSKTCAWFIRAPFVFISTGSGYRMDEHITKAFIGHNLFTIYSIANYYKTGHVPAD